MVPAIAKEEALTNSILFIKQSGAVDQLQRKYGLQKTENATIGTTKLRKTQALPELTNISDAGILMQELVFCRKR